MGQSHWLKKGPAEAVFPSPAEEVEHVTGAAETVLPSSSLSCVNLELSGLVQQPKTDIGRLQRTVRTTERVIGASLPNLQELYTSRERKRDKKVTLDPSHPAHYLFELLPSGRCSVDLSYPVRFSYLPLKQWVVQFDNEKYYQLNYILLICTPTTTLNVPLQ